VMPEVRLHYTTVGDPKNPAVLMLHGSAQSGGAMLNPGFAGELFGAGQPLDATKYFIILPDGFGHGKSTKPSDGLKARFPKYDYADMVDAHHRLLSEGLGIKHVRLVMGNSMGGMHVWLWGEKYPDYMDALVPMACQPTPMAARNWMMRRLIIDSVKNDPDWNGGNYTTQPRSLKAAAVFFGVATSGGTLAYSKLAPTRAAADKMLDERLAAPFAADANDFMYQWEASGDYDPTPGLSRITAPVLLINAADDERNPPETGLTEAALKQVKNGKLYLIPASTETRGHGTTANATFFARPLAEFMQGVPAVR
jgi:homoserine O-acetyltransferase/O-succinyltransferase